MSTGTVTIPEAGRLYRYGQHPNGEWKERIFVTAVETCPASWIVRGYRVTPSYVLTDEAVTESGPVGAPHGVRYDAFCTVAGDVPYGAGSPQQPLFSASFPASDASRVSSVEAAGRRQHLASPGHDPAARLAAGTGKARPS
jgi:hypothetical protein